MAHAVSQGMLACADGDILVVRELRNLINDAAHRAKVAPRAADEAAKWLDWPQYLQVVHELRCVSMLRQQVLLF